MSSSSSSLLNVARTDWMLQSTPVYPSKQLQTPLKVQIPLPEQSWTYSYPSFSSGEKWNRKTTPVLSDHEVSRDAAIAGLILTTVRTMISSRPKTFGEQDDLEGIHLRLRRGAGTIPWILAVGEIFRPALHHRVTHLESQRSWPRTARIKCRLIARKQKQSLAF